MAGSNKKEDLENINWGLILQVRYKNIKDGQQKYGDHNGSRS